MVAAKVITIKKKQSTYLTRHASCNPWVAFSFKQQSKQERRMGVLWAIIIGFLAGLIAKWITPGDNKPSGFILTTVLGIVGSVLATWLWQQISGAGPSDGVNFLSGIIGAVIILLAWSQIARRTS